MADINELNLEENKKRIERNFKDPVFVAVFRLAQACVMSELYQDEHDAHLKSLEGLHWSQRPLDASYWMNKRPRPMISEKDCKEFRMLQSRFNEVSSLTKDHESYDQRDMMLGSDRSLLLEMHDRYFAKADQGDK